MPALEPTLAALPNPLLRLFVALRPAFLSVTLVGCLLGLATAAYSGAVLQPVTATVTLFFALLAHGGANVVNDYYDAQSGCDAINRERIFPFTGGSRMIQNGVLTPHKTGIIGYSLLVLVIPAGLWLSALSGPGLVGIGLLGLLLAWAYSAPPCKLQSRGVGEFGITVAWLLVVVGSDFVQRRDFAFAPIATGLGFALLVANILYINQFPDIAADRSAGKHTLVVRLGAQRARWGYVLIAVLCYGWVGMMIISGHLPAVAAISLLPAGLSGQAARTLLAHAAQPQQLTPGIKCTIAAAAAHGLILAASLVFLA